MDRVILHSDLNNFYASVECLYRPELRDKPVVVGGDVTQRHGIVLAKNYVAKKYEIQTGEAIWQAKKKCPGLVVVPPNHNLYLKFSRMAREIYADYTDLVESFGIDECWLDVTGSVGLYGNGEEIAEKIRQRIKLEMGVTVSIGVSYNKIFAKLGSDMKKPDAITVITKENFKEKVWVLPASDLLYVGRSTNKTLQQYMINTIGDIANTSTDVLNRKLGKWGEYLWVYANGLDDSPVSAEKNENVVKSIGNGTTAYRNLENDNDVRMIIFALSESVSMRMREQGVKCRTVTINIRNSELYSYDRQCKINIPSYTTMDIANAAFALYKKNYDWNKPIRSITVRGTDFVGEFNDIQLDLFNDDTKRVKAEKIEKTIDSLRNRFGYSCVQRAVIMQDTGISSYNPSLSNDIHPVSYL